MPYVVVFIMKFAILIHKKMIMKYNLNLIKIKLFYLKLLGKIKNQSFLIDTRLKQLDFEDILIIFPVDDKSFRVAIHVFRDLITDYKSNNHYLLNRVYCNNLNIKGNIYNYSYFNKKVVIDKESIDKLNSIKDFNMIIDLNTSFFYDLCIFVNGLNAFYKIGLKNEYSDLFYNMQFCIKESNILEDGYKKINSFLNN